MVDKRKIKDIYRCSYHLPLDEQLYPLQKWYGKLIDKTYDELDILDVTRMIKQKEFIELAVHKAVDLLKDNPFCGELYEGEILEKMLELDMLYLSNYRQELKEILDKALKDNERYEWLIEEERIEYKNLVYLFQQKLLDNDLRNK